MPYWILERFATSGPESVTVKLPLEAQVAAAVNCAEARQLLHCALACHVTIIAAYQMINRKRQRVACVRIAYRLICYSLPAGVVLVFLDKCTSMAPELVYRARAHASA